LYAASKDKLSNSDPAFGGEVVDALDVEDIAVLRVGHVHVGVPRYLLQDLPRNHAGVRRRGAELHQHYEPCVAFQLLQNDGKQTSKITVSSTIFNEQNDGKQTYLSLSLSLSLSLFVLGSNCPKKNDTINVKA
jgi:hypothetical protein